MSPTPELPARLDRLGAVLHGAAVADLAASSTAPAAKPRRVRRRTGVVVLVGCAIVIPGAALAASALISSDEVARSIPNGTLSLLGTDPHCTVVRDNVEFDCVLTSAPHGELAPGAWKGTVEPTVDDSKHVNGGCRSLNPAGTHWRCYIGQEAVRQQIIGPDFLGQPSLGPGVG
jgi:hypothetical protein